MTRERLPDTRSSVTHRAKMFTKDGPIKFFITVGLFPDGSPGELFLSMDESGSTLDGFADAWSTAFSICLQHREPLESLLSKFSFQEFEPKGRTENSDISYARSVIDYVARWMMKQFLTHEQKPEGS